MRAHKSSGYVRHRTEPLAAARNNYHGEVPRKAVVQSAGVRTDKGSGDNIDGFFDQMKRGSK